MKKIFLYILTAAMVATMIGCSGINKLLKSGDYDAMYTTALQLYRDKKWSRASTLFEAAQPNSIGTAREDSISFYNAHCKFLDRDYATASELLNTFRRKFGRSVFIEQAEGMYASCFYYMSPGPTRDQTTTQLAIGSIDDFMSRYPESEQNEKFLLIRDELQSRLHEKSYINAYTYYKIRQYRSAIVAFKNALREYPKSEFREQIMYYIIDSSFRLADNSIEEKKVDRFMSTLDSYYSFIAEFPESEYRGEVDKILKKSREFIDAHQSGEGDETSTIQ